MLPQSEYTFLPSFPARVDAMTAAVGSEVVAPLITFAAGELVVRATLTEAQRAVCEPGQTVEIAGDEGLSGDGEIASIGHEEPADPAGGNGAPPSGVSLLVTPASRLDAKASGQNVRLTIETASSGGAELVVPVTGLFAAADGATYVTKRDAEGREQQVVVVPRLSAQGHVAVTVPDGRLAVRRSRHHRARMNPEPLIRLEQVALTYPGPPPVPALAPTGPHHPSRRVRDGGGTVRLRQVDPAEHPRAHRPSHRRQLPFRRRGHRDDVAGPADLAAGQADRTGLPGVPPAVAPHGGGERRPGPALPRGSPRRAAAGRAGGAGPRRAR